MSKAEKNEGQVSQGAMLLKEYRRDKQMTAEQLAAKVGCDKYMISRYENGVHVPEGRRVILLERLCKIPVDSWYL